MIMHVNEGIDVIHFVLVVTDALYQFNVRLYSNASNRLFQIL